MKRTALLLCLMAGVAITLHPHAVLAEMYKYVDAQGVLHFVDDLSQVPKKHRKKAKLVGDEGSLSYSDSGSVEKQKTTKPAANKVEMYVTSWCPTCKIAIKYMREQGIPFVAYDIEKDADAMRRFDDFADRNPGQGRVGVPLIIVGQHSMRGFDAQRIESWRKQSP